MPAVVSVECWPFGHASHDGALVFRENCPAAHGAHRAGVGSSALATNVPGVHGCVASQNGWPGFSWNVLAGHAVHDAALTLVLELPCSQKLQVRSAVALGGTKTRSPLAQTVCVVQKPFPSVLWYAPSGQIAHAGALLVLEKLPAAHGAHRAGD
jgi:hypothetical protein